MTNEEITRMLENIPAEKMQSFIKWMATQEAEHEAICKGSTPQEILKAYLDKMAEHDPQLATKYPQNPMGKTIKDCWEMIENRANELSGNKRQIGLTSFQVFDMAVRYFLDDEAKKYERPKNAPIAHTVIPKNNLESLLKEKENWETANKKKIDEWEKEHNAKIDAWELEHKQDLFPPENPLLKQENPFLKSVFPQQAQLDKLLTEKTKTTTKQVTPEPASAEPGTEPVANDNEDGEDIEEASAEELGELDY